MPLLSLTALLVLLSICPSAAQGDPGPSAQEVATSLQRKYDSIRDFSADFVHTYEGGVLRRKREERGSLLVKKPGKMRWEYKGDEEKLFVSNGVTIYQYLPEEKRVIRSPAPDDDQAAVLFLAGRGHLTRDFNVSFGQSPPGAWTLRLEPKKPDSAYDWLEITAARETFTLRSFTVGETQGTRSTFTFTNFKENPGLADTSFEFSIPKGVEVSSAGPVKR
jgi:outer membrane lipoprotein carrier protein